VDRIRFHVYQEYEKYFDTGSLFLQNPSVPRCEMKHIRIRSIIVQLKNCLPHIYSSLSKNKKDDSRINCKLYKTSLFDNI